ncbi:AraC family transcriptional regulator [Sediminicola luteus]|uniref:HTH araC/xylS-type domain-containing protein n=1 Tax=Sediminicola luteus TaxID=319238 RepID=A0A2A4G8Z0_9FLAO|nr:AraC family transcriptional regulator [Sediminicola luteus]PCE64440.1 hypothetical protein B7P33_09130 [Sediminicola luteus]
MRLPIIIFISFLSLVTAQQPKDTTLLHYLRSASANALENGNDSLFKQLNTEYYQLARIHKDTLCIVRSFFHEAMYRPYPANMIFADSIINLTKNFYKIDFPSYGYYLKGQLFEDNDALVPALDAYKTALDLATKKKDSLGILDALGGIGSIKLTLGRFKEAQESFHRSRNYIIQKKGSSAALRSNYNLARAFLHAGELDSARYYVDLGLSHIDLDKEYAVKSKAYHKFSAFYPSLVGLDAYVKFYQKTAMDEVKDSLTKFLPIYENEPIYLGWSHFVLGEIALLEGKRKQALDHFLTVDRLFGPEDWRFSKLKETYAGLIELKKSDNAAQLAYMEKYIRYDSIRNSKMLRIANEVTTNYDLPHVADLKKRIAESNNDLTRKKRRHFYIVSSILVVAFVISLVFHFRYRKTKKRLELLLNEEPVPAPIKVASQPKKSHALDTEHLTHILNRLNDFEKSDLFLDPTYNMQDLCQYIGRNANWTSKVISDYKNPEGFRAYLKDLRISYAIADLKRNTPKLTIAGMASSYGFGSANTFSKSFKERTQVTLSSFLAALPEKASA